MNAAPFPCVSNLPAPYCRSQLPRYEIYFTEISQDHLEIYDLEIINLQMICGLEGLESDCQDDWSQGLIGYCSRMVDSNNSENTVSWYYGGLQRHREKLIHLRLWTEIELKGHVKYKSIFKLSRDRYITCVLSQTVTELRYFCSQKVTHVRDSSSAIIASKSHRRKYKTKMEASLTVYRAYDTQMWILFAKCQKSTVFSPYN